MSPGCDVEVVGAYTAPWSLSFACPQLWVLHSLIITVVNAELVQNYYVVEIAIMSLSELYCFGHMTPSLQTLI